MTSILIKQAIRNYESAIKGLQRELDEEKQRADGLAKFCGSMERERAGFPGHLDLIDPATGNLKVLGLTLDQLRGLRRFFEKHTGRSSMYTHYQDIADTPLKKSKLESSMNDLRNWAQANQGRAARLEAIIRDALIAMDRVAHGSKDAAWRRELCDHVKRIEKRMETECPDWMEPS